MTEKINRCKDCRYSKKIHKTGWLECSELTGGITRYNYSCFMFEEREQ